MALAHAAVAHAALGRGGAGHRVGGMKGTPGCRETANQPAEISACVWRGGRPRSAGGFPLPFSARGVITPPALIGKVFFSFSVPESFQTFFSLRYF